MVRRAVATLAGLGLIGGAGSVAYNHHGDAVVKITDKSGHVQTVVINAAGGKTFSCPTDTHDQLASLDIKAGRIKLTLQQVRRAERKLERLYPSHTAPHAEVLRYNALARRDDRLVDAYNADIDEHNAMISRLCTAN